MSYLQLWRLLGRDWQGWRAVVDIYTYLKRLLSLHLRHLHDLLFAHANDYISIKFSNRIRRASHLFVGFVTDTQLQVVHDSLDRVRQHLRHAHVL